MTNAFVVDVDSLLSLSEALSTSPSTTSSLVGSKGSWNISTPSARLAPSLTAASAAPAASVFVKLAAIAAVDVDVVVV